MVSSVASSGEIWLHLKDDIMFELPSVVPHELAMRCGGQVFAENTGQVSARVELLRRMRQMELELAKVQGKLSRRILGLYSEVRAQDPDEWTSITLFDVARILAPELPPDFNTRLSLHKLLMDNPKEFVADSFNYRTSQMFHIRPQSHVERLKRVSEFSRQDKNNPVEAFAARARVVIAENQQRARESSSEPHSVQVGKQEIFTSADSIIINFLRDSLRTLRLTQIDPYPVNTARIVKAIGLYPGKVDDSLVCQVLIDLGMMAPWQDIASLDRNLEIEQEPEETSQRVAAQNAIVREGLEKRRNASHSSGQVLGPHDFYPNDMLESIRHDFGTMPVYVIDDFGAEELDDGVSFEAIPSEPECAWIHVHIADPTAVIPPTHVFAEQARAMVSTQYFGHRTWPMLPQSAMHTLVPSVGDSIRSGEPERVMSFSFKVDGTGDIVDYKVRAGIIRNVTRTTYDAVDHALGIPPLRAEYPFGGAPDVPAHIPLNEQQRANVQSLKAVTDRMVARTSRLPIFIYGFPKANVTLAPKPLYTAQVDSQKPSIFRGFPKITYAVDSWEDTCVGAHSIVTQCMTAASRISSRWALDHGVPLLRRSASQPMTLSDNDFADILASKNSLNLADPVLALRKALITPGAIYTLDPGVHWSLGIPEGEGYCRVTSPLRRHSDMVAHWQIKHAMLNPDASPLFSPEWLQDYGRELSLREKLQKRAHLSHADFWALRFIQRWMADSSRADGLDPLTDLSGYTTSDPIRDTMFGETRAKIIVPQLGLRGFLIGLDKGTMVGQKHNLAVKDVKTGINSQIHFGVKV